MHTITWQVVPAAAPTVLRHCKKCGKKTAFSSSDLFRVNAQKRTLDIWLIYNCDKCGTSWNAAIHSRIPPQSLPLETLEAYHKNDADMAARWANDVPFLQSLGCDVELSDFEILGPILPENEPAALEITAPCPLPLKVSALVRQKLNLSRREFDAMLETGILSSPSGQDLAKCKLGRGITLFFHPHENTPGRP